MRSAARFYFEPLMCYETANIVLMPGLPGFGALVYM